MSTQALTGLRDYLTGTLSTNDMMWLVEELKEYVRKGEALEPYTIEELHERIAQSERDFAEGRYFTDDEVFEDLGMVAEEQEELNQTTA
ncbi:MAG: hypothetical protein J5733_12555 [Bacteroidaceae bacterium]|nr:hypothetical protein [Bacteroidaceae bacterium]